MSTATSSSPTVCGLQKPARIEPRAAGIFFPLQCAVHDHIGPGEVHLWLARPDEIRDVYLLQQYRNLLTDEERTHEMAIRDPRERHSYLLTRALVRTTLSRYATVAPEDWRFFTDASGQLHIANPPGEANGLTLNISSKHETIMLGIARHRALGVDMEVTTDDAPPLEIAETCFSTAEWYALCDVPTEEQGERFFAYWTLKEAYIKARGAGLSLPPEAFGFELDESDSLQFWSLPRLDPHPDGWRFWQFAIEDSGGMAAICVERLDTQDQKLLARITVPGVFDRPLQLRMLRQS